MAKNNGPLYAASGDHISKWWNQDTYRRPKGGFNHPNHYDNWRRAKRRHERDNISLPGAIAREAGEGIWSGIKGVGGLLTGCCCG